jgi:hypothetical protein
MNIADLSKANPDEVLVSVKGMEVRLSDAMKAGVVRIDGDKVVAREAAPAPKPAPPAAPLDLGDRWQEHRNKIGSRAVDNSLVSCMAAVLEGKNGPELETSLSRLNDSAQIGATSPAQIKAVYNQLSQNVVRAMGREMEKAFPNEIPRDDGKAIVEALLKVARGDQAIGILTSAVHGDKSWIKRAEDILRREIRIRSGDKNKK